MCAHHVEVIAAHLSLLLVHVAVPAAERAPLAVALIPERAIRWLPLVVGLIP